jgi:hypothetical protein
MGLVAVIVVPAVVGPAGAQVATLDSGRMGTELNGAREQAGLEPLLRRADLDAVAQRHTDRMAAEGGPPFHSGDPAGGLTGWERVGEIVGRTDGSNPDWPAVLTRAFLESPRHRVELLDARYLELGVGAAMAGDGVYVTGVLMRRTAAPPPPPQRVLALSSVGGPEIAAAPPAPPPSNTPPMPTTTPTTAAPPPAVTAPPAPAPAAAVAASSLVAAPPPVDLGSDVMTISNAGPAVAGAGGRVILFVMVVIGAIAVAGLAPQRRRPSTADTPPLRVHRRLSG